MNAPPRAGHKTALDEVQRQATAKGALKAVPLAVSGAFHTPLMQPAREALEQASWEGGWLERADRQEEAIRQPHLSPHPCLPVLRS